MKTIKNFEIVMIGAGNVATHLARALHAAGHHITSVFSATEESAQLLAGQVRALWTNSLSELPDKADAFIISVRDNALEEVVAGLRVRKGTVMHTTGSVGMDILKDRFAAYGVLYPFQTFRKEQEMEMKEVPMLIEAGSGKDLTLIRDLAGSISSRVMDFNSEQRLNLHLTAAFACNFTNYMVSIAEEILEEHHIDRSLLQPLLDETFRKFALGPAADMQTGPAVRGDTKTIEIHTDLLKNHPEWQKLYTFMSQLIQNDDKL